MPYKRAEDKRAHNLRYTPAWKASNPDKVQAAQQRYRERHKGELKAAVIAAYGGRCACCGETNHVFLTLEHPNGDGAEHRHRLGRSGDSVYYDLKKRGWPPGFEILCWNCQWGRRSNGGVCPHQENMLKVVNG
jgi:hypothetical protein